MQKQEEYELPDWEYELDLDDQILKSSLNFKQSTQAKAPTFSSFKDFLFKPEILSQISKCGFEVPSQVQQECIPYALIGQDILCQAKSGSGKTAVFVLALLQAINPKTPGCKALVICNTRELAYQIQKEFVRFGKDLTIRSEVFFGGQPLKENIEILKRFIPPDIIVGTPGRIRGLIRHDHLKLDQVKHFVMDECDTMLSRYDWRQDIQAIFKSAPIEKQVMMFSATLSEENRKIAQQFMRNPNEFILEENQLESVIPQFYQRMNFDYKKEALTILLDAIAFNQVIIFVNTTTFALQLKDFLTGEGFPCAAICSEYSQQERILVSTDIFSRGIDMEKVNLVINYDMAQDLETYHHRVFNQKLHFIDRESWKIQHQRLGSFIHWQSQRIRYIGYSGQSEEIKYQTTF